ncbi:MAG: ABC transporter substrate-binding protein [Deltaproteobacteria bacterium]|nr:ABC transporter substrate-binding protein [Deltaproteobacteria bacterium]
MKKKAVMSILIALSMLMFLPAAQAQDVLKIGGLMTTSGPAAHLGKVCLNGVNMKVNEVNAAGGIKVGDKQYKVEYINYDDKCSAKDSVSATERLIQNDKVPVIMGAICSHCTLADMQVTEKAEVPLVTPISSSVKITTMGYKYIFRTWSQAAVQAETICRFAVQDLQLKKCAYLGRNDAWSRSAAKEFQKRMKLMGGEVVATEFYELGTTDFYPQLTKIKAAKPDFIYFCSLTEDGALAVKQAREIGITSQFMGTDEMGNEQMLKVAGNAIVGAYLYFTQGPPSAATNAYVKKYKEKYKIESNAIDKGGYDTIGLILDAIQRAGTVTDGEKIRQALSDTNYEGVKQKYSFTKSGQARINMFIVKVEKTGAKPIKSMDVYSNPSAPL